MTSRARLVVCATALLWSLTVAAAGPEDLNTATFQGRSLGAVLEAYRQAGFEFIYSTDLVRPALTIAHEPVPSTPIGRLVDALYPLGLTLRATSDGRRWLIVLAEPEGAQEIAGRVVDSQTGAPVAGVHVEVAGRQVVTDSEGEFTIKAPAGSRGGLSVSHDGYVEQSIARARLNENLEIALQANQAVEEIIIISSRYLLQKDTPVSKHSLDADEFNAIPELGEDALRASTHLPGTASLGLSAKPYIRGGLQDEILVLFDGVELLEPFHLKDFQSVFSSLNPSLIRSIDVYTGGYPARFGDRMSGVMDIEADDALRGKGAEVTVSLLTTAAAAFGTVADGRGSWAVSGRRGNLDLITKYVNPSLGEPSYSDAFGQFAWQLDDRTEVEFDLLVYNDDINLRDLDGDIGSQATSRYRNVYGWVQAHHQHSSAAWSTTTLSYGSIRHNRTGVINEPEPWHNVGATDDARQFQVWNLSHVLESELSNQVGLEIGVRLNHQVGRYDYSARVERNDNAAAVGIPQLIDRRIQTKPRGASGSAFSSVQYRASTAFSLQAGLRWDFQEFTQVGYQQQVSPRVSAVFNVTPVTHLRFSAGRFHQAEGIHELQVTDGLDEYQKPQHADHYIAGLEHHFRSNVSFRFEAFHKRFGALRPRFENLFNSLVLLPELGVDRVGLEPNEARASGVELTARYRPDDDLNIWLSYTHSSAQDLIDGHWERRTWDQRHTAQAGMILNDEAWSMSTTVTWHSGWHTTALPAVINGPLDDLQRNDTPLPNYFSLDARLSRSWEWPENSLTLFAEVTNLTDRDNVGGVAHEFDPVETDSSLLVTADPEKLLPLIPSLGLVWRFL